jgi:hypothetical protein
LKEYAKQRSLEFLGPNLYQNKLQQVRDFDLKPVAKQAGVSAKFFLEKPVPPSPTIIHDNEVS